MPKWLAIADILLRHQDPSETPLHQSAEEVGRKK